MEEAKVTIADNILEHKEKDCKFHLKSCETNGDYFHGLAKEDMEFMRGVVYVMEGEEGFPTEYWRLVLEKLFTEWNNKAF